MRERTTIPARARPLLAACVIAALLALVAYDLAAFRFADHDMFHQMALARAAIELGHFPRDDVFAFTPTISPVVHHEWGLGFILHGVWGLGGLEGVAVLRLLLIAGILALSTATARLRGAAWGLIAALAPLGLLFLGVGFSPVRAQLFTLLFLSAQLLMMELDRRGNRVWVPLWLLMLIPWLNIHGGFVVGPAVLALHWAEQVARTRRPQWHLVFAGLACVPLMLLNPYGTDFLRYLVAAVTAPRGAITEWAPLWAANVPLEFAGVVLAAVLTLFAAITRGWRSLPGLIILIAAMVEALLHRRHESILGVVWLAYAPSMLAGTPLHRAVTWLIDRARIIVMLGAAAATAACISAMPAPPWRLEVPEKPEPGAGAVIPVGAADFLERTGFQGNVLTPFNGSAYLSWRLWPRVKVSLDSRYEAAFPPGAVQEHLDFYSGEADWFDLLIAHDPDLVLAPAGCAVIAQLTNHAWTILQQDEGHVLLAPPPLPAP